MPYNGDVGGDESVAGELRGLLVVVAELGSVCCVIGSQMEVVGPSCRRRRL